MKCFRLRYVSCIALTIALGSAALIGQSGDWGRVRRIAVNTPLIIKTTKHPRIECRSKSASDIGLTVYVSKGELALDRGSIKRVYVAVPKRRNGARLATAFVAVGALIGFAWIDSRVNGSSNYPSMFPFFGAAGVAAIVQKQLTKGFKKGDLIYKVD